MPYMTIVSLNLQITRSDIRPQTKWAVCLVIAYGHLIFPPPEGTLLTGVCVSMYGLTDTHITPEENHNKVTLQNHQIRHQATNTVGCHPGDCIWLFNLPQGFVWECMG